MRQRGISQFYGDADGMFIFLWILRHTGGDHPFVVRDRLHRLQPKLRRAEIPAEANRRRYRCKHDPSAHTVRQQERHQRSKRHHPGCIRQQMRRQHIVRQNDRRSKAARDICQLPHPRTLSLSLFRSYYSKKRRQEQDLPPFFSANYRRCSPIDAPPRTWKCRWCTV